MKRSSQPNDDGELDDDSVPLIASNAIKQLSQGQPVETQAQEAIIQQFWDDKKQQDTVWRVVLAFTAACLLALLVSLRLSPLYSLLHASFTEHVEARFASSEAVPAVLVLLAASVLASLSLTTLIEPARAAFDSPSLLWSPLFVLSSLLTAAVLSVTVYVGSAAASQVDESDAMRWLWCVVFVSCLLYWLVGVHSVTSTRGLGAEIRRLTKLKYSYHTA